ncbi:hypothetical protein GIB67_004958, partial [Kingdonia uniflora]
NRDTSNPQTSVSSRRLPSGCVVQDIFLLLEGLILMSRCVYLLWRACLHLGDCVSFLEKTGKQVLPTLTQVKFLVLLLPNCRLWLSC